MAHEIITTLQPPPSIVTTLEVGQGPAGPPGTSNGSGSDYTHTQAVASATWVINHNLNKQVLVGLFTVGGVEFEAEVVHTSLDQVTVLLSTPVAGYARVI